MTLTTIEPTTPAPTVAFTATSVGYEPDGEGGEVLMATGHVDCTTCKYRMAVVVECGLLGHGHCPRCAAEHWFEQRIDNPHLQAVGQPVERVDMRQADLTVRYAEGF